MAFHLACQSIRTGEVGLAIAGLLPWAIEQGRGYEYCLAFMRGVWSRGINAGSNRGLARIVADAGLDWQDGRRHLGSDDWRAEAEANREELFVDGIPAVDSVLTTREFIRMIHEAGIDFKNLEPMDAEPLMGQYTGAGTIFGATGGVMEAAIRTVYEVVTGRELPSGSTAVEASAGLIEPSLSKSKLVMPLATHSSIAARMRAR